MKKVRIIKDGKIIFESDSYYEYENSEFIEFDFSNLENADLRFADLYNADLYNANLINANLRFANLYNANLKNANLINANLYNANLENANLENANLYNAYLDKEIRKGYINKKERIVYKKCNNKIVELELLKNSIVFSINNKKCRTNRAKVVSIDGDKTTGLKVESNHDANFVYEVGKIVEVKDFNLMYNVECASGIHFFMNREDAEQY